MTYVATEICDETGSWLSDFNLNETFVLPKAGNLIFGRKTSTYQRLCDEFFFRTKRIIIRKPSRMERDLSYKIHTNRELTMMLSGEKPFAVFSVKKDEEFDTYNGQKFNKFRSLIKSSKIVIDDVTFFLKFIEGEEWRVNAYCTVEKVRSYLGNSIYIEAMVGELLGYSPEQNREYIDKFCKDS